MSTIARGLFSLLVFAVALALIYGGFKLVALDGSSYYLLAGLAYLLLAALFVLRKPIGIALSVVVFLATCVWASTKWVSSATGNCCRAWWCRRSS